MEPPNRPIFIILIALSWGVATAFWLPRGLSHFWQGVWLVALFAAMVLVDRLYVLWWRRRQPDPMSLHWSELRNREGDFVCAACRSIFLLPPPDLDPGKMVTCGDCGHVVAPYGEMQPHLHALARHNLPRIALRWPRWW